MRSVVVDQPVGRDGLEHALTSSRRQASIQRKCGVAVVPRPPERVDELRAAGKIDRNKVRHGEKATVTP